MWMWVVSSKGGHATACRDDRSGFDHAVFNAAPAGLQGQWSAMAWVRRLMPASASFLWRPGLAHRSRSNAHAVLFAIATGLGACALRIRHQHLLAHFQGVVNSICAHRS